jgi:competence protein ComEC
MEEIKVEKFAYPLALQDAPDYSSTFSLARQKSIPLWGLQAGQMIQVEPGFSLEVLYPAQGTAEISDANHSSLVLKCRYNKSSILLTGDLDKEAMQEIVAQKANLNCDLLKVPHHGSRSSLVEEFYQNCNPKAAVISVGSNQFGHPHPEVLDELTGQGIPIYRTDLHGAIRCTSDGAHLTIESFIN